MEKEPTFDERNREAAERFLSILNNRGKREKGSEAVRRNGFVVLVRGAHSLRDIQTLCLDQSYNECLTIRYRLKSGPIVGTLISLFMSDLQQVQADMPNIRGRFMPEASEERWSKLINRGFYDEVYDFVNLHPQDLGMLNAAWLRNFLRAVSDERFFPTGTRLVLFCEVENAGHDIREWELATRALFRILPERFGFVFLGAPDSFSLPVNDPHFLELAWQDEAAAGAAAGERADSFKISALRDDQPAKDDLLDVGEYAQALARLILHEQTHPLTIGIQAPWGKGKSSFMNFVERELVKWAPSNAERTTECDRMEQDVRALERKLNTARSSETSAAIGQSLLEKRQHMQRLWKEMAHAATDDVITIEFNAWRYEDAKQIWAGLASHITGRLEEALPWLKRKWTRLLYAWQHRRQEVVAFLFSMAAALLIGSALIVFRPGGADALLRALAEGKMLPESFNLALLLVPSASLVLLVWFVVWRLYRVVQPVSKRILEYGRLPDYREQMGFQNKVLDDVRFMYERVSAHVDVQPGRPRVVVFIDDLDRCSEEKIMDMLQAINLILGASRFYVLLGIDTEMLYRAIRNYYTKNKLDQSLPPNFPEDYLRKIIQLPFHLPESPPNVRFSLVKSFFSQEAQRTYAREESDKQAELVESPQEEEMEEIELIAYDRRVVSEPGWKPLEPVEDTPEELAAFDAFRDFLQDNPRELKRLVNVHRLVKILLQRRDVAWPVATQRKLVKWLVFCACWPELIDDALLLARDHGDTADCLAQLMTTLQHPDKKKIGEFNKRGSEVLSAADLQPGGRLHLAANFSNLVKEQAQPQAQMTPPPAVETGAAKRGRAKSKRAKVQTAP